jgi:hypothetical protein
MRDKVELRVECIKTELNELNEKYQNDLYLLKEDLIKFFFFVFC